MDISVIEVLVQGFERDIIYDCHSLRIAISRSSAGRMIATLSKAEKEEIKNYLKTHEVATANPQLKENMEKGWQYILS